MKTLKSKRKYNPLPQILAMKEEEWQASLVWKRESEINASDKNELIAQVIIGLLMDGCPQSL